MVKKAKRLPYVDGMHHDNGGLIMKLSTKKKAFAYRKTHRTSTDCNPPEELLLRLEWALAENHRRKTSPLQLQKPV